MSDEHKVYTFPRRIKDIVIITKALSTSGKYEIFYGEHIRAGKQCFDVGSLNGKSGEIVRRHYSTKEEALAFWEDFHQRMTSPDSIPDENEGEKYVIL